MSEECMWCGGSYPTSASSTHEYIESTSGCWDAFNGILAKQYAHPLLFQQVNRLTVDTYTVQHPGKPSRKAIQSVIGHLVSLYYALELNYSPIETTKEITSFVNKKYNLIWLDPPPFATTLKASDVLAASSVEKHIDLVTQWADSVWQVWKDKHLETLFIGLKNPSPDVLHYQFLPS